LGAESDHVKVAAGYARNYLFPQGLAIPVTAANKRRLEVLRQKRAEREAHELNSMTELAKSMSKVVLVLKVKTGEDGKMFGSVTAGTIADELKHQLDVTLDKRKIHLEHPIRTLGDHEVELRLYQGVNANLKVKIESTTPLPKVEETAPAGPAQGGKREAPAGGKREPQPGGRAEGKRPEHRKGEREPRPANTPEDRKPAGSRKPKAQTQAQ
jgi:large subunit ribosomal protein L9